MKIIKLLKSNTHIFLVSIIVLISLPFLSPLYKPGVYMSHDSEPQIVRMGSVYKALSDGQFPPRWAGDLNHRYGNPSPNFFFPLKGYLGSVVHTLGFSLENSFKILMGLSFILASVFFYFWISQIFDKKAAFLGALFYGLAPYHFIDAYVRGQLGEMLAFVFIPLVLLFIEKNFQKPSASNIILGGLSYGFLAVSHNILAFVFSFAFFFYIIFRCWGNIRSVMSNFMLLFMGLLASSFFWIPALYESKYINSKLFVSDFFINHFLPLEKLVYTQWGFGSNINLPGGLSPYLGPIHFILILIGLLVFNKVKNKKFLVFWFFILLFSIFISTSLSRPIWERIHLLQQFQFPWRLMALSSFAAASIISALFFTVRNKFFYIISLFALLFLSLQLVKVKGFTEYKDAYYLDYVGTAAYHGEATTIWTAGNAKELPREPVEVVSGTAEIKGYKRKSNLHTFRVLADEDDTKLVDNTTYFPGWRVEVNGQKVPIEFQDINYRGLITFGIPKGESEIRVFFTESPVRLIADILSASALFIILTLFILRKRIDKLITRR